MFGNSFSKKTQWRKPNRFFSTVCWLNPKLPRAGRSCGKNTEAGSEIMKVATS